MPSEFLLTSDSAHGLCWWRDDLLLDVYLGNNCGHLPIAETLTWWEMAVGRPIFMKIVDAIPDMMTAFADATVRAGLTRVILMQGTGDDPNHGDTDLRFDERSGRIRSALVTLPHGPGPYLATVVRHELGHVLGLAHWPDGLMVAMPESPDTPPPLAEAQLAALRGVLG